MKYIIDIHGEIEGDYEIIEPYHQGNWIEISTSVVGKTLFRCPFCHNPESFKAKFCINCGADLRGGV